MNLFDFQLFLEELRSKPDKAAIVSKYETLIEPLEGKQIEDLVFYREYLSKINTIPYNVPEELKDDFDWDMLAKLVIGSFSSDYEYSKANDTDELPELCIYVASGGAHIAKKISELWSFQILRLYEIYLEEAMNLESLKKDDLNEQNAIDQERVLRVRKWNNKYSEFVSRHGFSQVNELKSEIEKFLQ